jgi:hypothetical protein
MKLYGGWQTGSGDGSNIMVLQILARADSEYKSVQHLGQWTTKNKASELLGLQADLITCNYNSMHWLLSMPGVRQNLLQLQTNLKVLQN